MAKHGPGRAGGTFTQSRRFERLREFLERHPRGASLYELARALDVSPRTMRRYLKELERRYELDRLPSQDGRYFLWRVNPVEMPRKVELRRTQAYALLAARRVFEPMRGSALFDEIDLAVNKLLSFARRPGRGPNAGLADANLEHRFLYLPHAPKTYAERTEALDDLFQAVADLRPLHLSYQSATSQGEERITIHPYALVLHRDSIYAVGLHLGRGETRTFVLDRMRDTECAVSERFEVPGDFSIDEYFQGEFGVWRSSERHRVVIEFDALAAPYVRRRRFHPSQRLMGIAGGGVRLTMVIGDLRPVVSWLLEWGPRARALEPAALVDQVRAELAQALGHYDRRTKSARSPSSRARKARA